MARFADRDTDATHGPALRRTPKVASSEPGPMSARDLRPSSAGSGARSPIALADTGSRTRALDALQGSHGNQAVQRLIDVQRDEDEWSLDTPLGSVDVAYDPSTGSISGSVDTAAGGASAAYNTHTGSASGAVSGGQYSAAGSYDADTGAVSGSMASAHSSASGAYNTETGSASGEVTTPSGSATGSYDAASGEATGSVAVGDYGAAGSYNRQTGEGAGAVSSPTYNASGSYSPETGARFAGASTPGGAGLSSSDDSGEIAGRDAGTGAGIAGSSSTETEEASAGAGTPEASLAGEQAGAGLAGPVTHQGSGPSDEASRNTRGGDHASAWGMATMASPRGTSTGRDEQASRAAQGQAVSARPTLARGSQGRMVGDLQQRLISAGFPCGAADGIFGPKTHRAVSAFQEANGLVADGIVGRRTWAALGV